MDSDEPFDLSKFMPDGLDVNSICKVPVKRMYPAPPFDQFMGMVYQNPLHVLGENSFKQIEKPSVETVGSPLQEFYREANVFVTGGTGFFGKVLIQKLVRSIPHIGQIYVIIRGKRGKNPQERFEQMFEDKVFLRMKVEVPHYLSKITMVEGDISTPGLGLSDSDRQLLMERVHVVFHSAADVRFIEPLRAAIRSNVLGSWNVLELAKQMTLLKSYVHVSTAYSQCVLRVVPESIPKLPVHYKNVLSEIESLTDEELEKQTPRLLLGWPNTYTFSKAVCENMLMEEAQDMPLCVFRPSIVTSTYKEPVRGWTDNMYGPNALLVGGSLGVIHEMCMDLDVTSDMVPVDYVINCMIAAAWATTTFRYELSPPVFNFTSRLEKPSWKNISDFGMKYTHCWPLMTAIWYPSVVFLNSELVDNILHVILHKIPGEVLDKIAVLNGQKPRLRRVYEKLYSMKKPLKFFKSRMWEFQNDNVVSLRDALTVEDKKIFKIDVRDVDFKEYIFASKLGARYYLMKEGMETLTQASRKNSVLYWAHKSLMMLFCLVVLKLLVATARILPF